MKLSTHKLSDGQKWSHVFLSCILSQVLGSVNRFCFTEQNLKTRRLWSSNSFSGFSVDFWTLDPHDGDVSLIQTDTFHVCVHISGTCRTIQQLPGPVQALIWHRSPHHGPSTSSVFSPLLQEVRSETGSDWNQTSLGSAPHLRSCGFLGFDLISEWGIKAVSLLGAASRGLKAVCCGWGWY